jgi:hypothetical protein
VPVVGGGSYRLYGVTLADEGPLVDGEPPDGFWHCKNTGFVGTNPGTVQFNGPAFIETVGTDGTNVNPAGSPPAGFKVKTRPVFTGPIVRTVFALGGVNNSSDWSFGGVSGVDGNITNAENTDPLLLYIELLDGNIVNLTRLDGFPFDHAVCAQTGFSSANVAGGAGTIEGGYEIVWWWWLKPDKDSCGNDQTSHLVLAADAPDDSYSKLDPDDEDAHPTPVISYVDPSHGPVVGGNVVAIIGSGFGDGAAVTFDGAAATGVNVVSQYRIECDPPAHAAGSANVVVTNADGVHS